MNSSRTSHPSVPLPKRLGYLADAETRPPLMDTQQVRSLVEWWGYTRNGEEYVKRLVRSGKLVPVKVPCQRGNRYPVESVLALWEG